MARVFDSGRRPWEWTGRRFACPFRRAFCGSGLVREDGGSDDASSENVMASARTSPLPQGFAFLHIPLAKNTWEWTGRHLACPFRRAFCGSGFVREDGSSDDASSENVMASSRTSPLPQGLAYNAERSAYPAREEYLGEDRAKLRLSVQTGFLGRGRFTQDRAQDNYMELAFAG